MIGEGRGQRDGKRGWKRSRKVRCASPNHHFLLVNRIGGERQWLGFGADRSSGYALQEWMGADAGL